MFISYKTLETKMFLYLVISDIISLTYPHIFIQLLKINNMYLKLQKIIVVYLQDWLFKK